MPDWIFTIHEPGQRPRQVPIRADLGLGRGEECECTLRDQAASSWHAIVKDIEGRLALIDLGSTNRTRVRGGATLGRGDHVFLRPGMELLIGRTVLLVEQSVQEVDRTLRVDSGASPGAWEDETGATGGAPDPVPAESSWNDSGVDTVERRGPPRAASASEDAPWRIERRRVVLGRPEPRPVPVERPPAPEEEDPTDPTEEAP